jgi:hypothetical protein
LDPLRVQRRCRSEQGTLSEHLSCPDDNKTDQTG